jgi:L-lactate utilization protein LutC
VTRQHGPRAQVLGRLRDRLAGGVPANAAHPAPAPQATAPAPRFRVVDPGDLVGTFVRTATEAGATVHRAAVADPSEVPPDLLSPILAPILASAPGVAVLTRDPEAVALGVVLARLGVTCSEHDPATAATAALGVTGSVAAVAATGSVVLDAARAGGRGASLLPPMHLCVVRASTVVATPGDVLRAVGTGAPPPSNLVLVTGPSRTGDIEQILTVGVHGPAAVHVVVLDHG